MTAFHAPTDDILFSLIHVARADRLPGWDSDLAREITGHFAAFAEERIAPLDATGDADGCRLENGVVRTPDGFEAAYRAARSALIRCSPYGDLPREKYGQWRQIEVVFNPEGMVSW